MSRKPAERPAELELEILKVLWDQTPLLVRDVRRQLAERGRDLAHTTVITTLNTMFNKGFVHRTADGNAFLFSSRISRDQVSSQMLDDVVVRAFDGSATAVMLSLFSHSDIHSDDLKELRRILNRKLRKECE